MEWFGILNGIFLYFGWFIPEVSSLRYDWLSMFTNIVYAKEFGSQGSICVLRLQSGLTHRSLWF